MNADRPSTGMPSTVGAAPAVEVLVQTVGPLQENCYLVVDPATRAAAIVQATTFHDDPDVIAKVSRGLGEPMVGINISTLPESEKYATRGW